MWMESNMITNIQKGLWVRQLMLIPKDFTLFKTPIALASISLASFKEDTFIITIDSYEISLILSESSSELKMNRLLIKRLNKIDELVSYMKNFYFAAKFFAKES